MELYRIFNFFCMFWYNIIIWCVKSLHSKSSWNMMIKIKLRPFLLCRTVINRGFVQYKEQWGMFLPWKIRDFLTPMKILHFNDSQGDPLVGGQATPPQRWECEKRGNFLWFFCHLSWEFASVNSDWTETWKGGVQTVIVTAGTAWI